MSRKRTAAALAIGGAVAFSLAAISCESSGPTVVRGSGVQNEPYRPAPEDPPIGSDRPPRPTVLPETMPTPRSTAG